MSAGEDVYDLAGANYCGLCDAPHSPCEPPDLRFECLWCFKPIEVDDEVEVNGQPLHPECVAIRAKVARL